MNQTRTQTREAELLNGVSICWGVRVLAAWEQRNQRSYHAIKEASFDADFIRDPYRALIRKYKILAYCLVLGPLAAGLLAVSAVPAPMMANLALIALFTWGWMRLASTKMGLGRNKTGNLEGFTDLFDEDTHYGLVSSNLLDQGCPLFARDIALTLFSPQVVAARDGDRLERLATRRQAGGEKTVPIPSEPERRM